VADPEQVPHLELSHKLQAPELKYLPAGQESQV